MTPKTLSLHSSRPAPTCLR